MFPSKKNLALAAFREALFDEMERQNAAMFDATISMSGYKLLIQGNLEIDIRSMKKFIDGMDLGKEAA